MEAVILGAGAGTRLSPLTSYVNKHFFPIFNQPLIYFPISTALALGCKKIIILINSWHRREYESLALTLTALNVTVVLVEQEVNVKGIPSAIAMTEDYITSDDVLVILGDNVFIGDHDSLRDSLEVNMRDKSVVVSSLVEQPNRFGVIERDTDEKVLRFIEKPSIHVSNEILTGIYYFPKRVFTLFHDMKKSARGETEITDMLTRLLRNGDLSVMPSPLHSYWNDAGTPESLHECSSVVLAAEEGDAKLGGYIEHVALKTGLISQKEYQNVLKELPPSTYRARLTKLQEVCVNRV